MQKFGLKSYGITILFALLMIVILAIPSFSQTTGAVLTLQDDGVVFQNCLTPAWLIEQVVPTAQRQILNDGMVNFPITVTKGDYTNNPLKVISYVRIENTGDEKAVIGNVVVIMQKLTNINDVLHWETVSFDVADSDIGDIAGTALTTYGKVKQNTASSFLEFMDKDEKIAYLNHPIASLDPQQIVGVRICAQFNNNILGLVAGDKVRSQLLITYGNAADATAFNMDINGNGAIEPNEARVRTKILRSYAVLPETIQEDDEVMLTDTILNDSGIGAGVVIGSGDPTGTVYNYNISFNANASPDNALITSKVNLDSVEAFGSIHKRVGAQVWVGIIPDASPSDLVAAPGAAGEINLAWVDNTTNELSFILERSTSPGFVPRSKVYDIPANSTSFVDKGLTSGTKYYYRITATNAFGTAPFSNAANTIAP